jgi:hypothetical protein
MMTNRLTVLLKDVGCSMILTGVHATDHPSHCAPVEICDGVLVLCRTLSWSLQRNMHRLHIDSSFPGAAAHIFLRGSSSHH